MKTEIKLGQVFYVDGNMYVITKPVSEEEMKQADCFGFVNHIWHINSYAKCLLGAVMF